MLQCSREIFTGTNSQILCFVLHIGQEVINYGPTGGMRRFPIECNSLQRYFLIFMVYFHCFCIIRRIDSVLLWQCIAYQIVSIAISLFSVVCQRKKPLISCHAVRDKENSIQTDFLLLFTNFTFMPCMPTRVVSFLVAVSFRSPATCYSKAKPNSRVHVYPLYTR